MPAMADLGLGFPLGSYCVKAHIWKTVRSLEIGHKSAQKSSKLTQGTGVQQISCQPKEKPFPSKGCSLESPALSAQAL
jgi:hypothetical protein